jgi:hypothetical protein
LEKISGSKRSKKTGKTHITKSKITGSYNSAYLRSGEHNEDEVVTGEGDEDEINGFDEQGGYPKILVQNLGSEHSKTSIRSKIISQYSKASAKTKETMLRNALERSERASQKNHHSNPTDKLTPLTIKSKSHYTKVSTDKEGKNSQRSSALRTNPPSHSNSKLGSAIHSHAASQKSSRRGSQNISIANSRVVNQQ